MNAVIEHIKAGDKAHLVQRALFQRLVFGPCLLSDEARLDMPDLNIMLVWFYHHTLFLHLVKLGLEQVLALLVVLRDPYFEGGRSVLFSERKRCFIGVFNIGETLLQVFIKGRKVCQVNFFEAQLLGRCEEIVIDSDLGQNRFGVDWPGLKGVFWFDWKGKLLLAV